MRPSALVLLLAPIVAAASAPASLHRHDAPRPAISRHTATPPETGNGRLWQGGAITRDADAVLSRHGSADPNETAPFATAPGNPHAHPLKSRCFPQHHADLPVPRGTLMLRRPLPASWHTRPVRVTSGFSNPVASRASEELRSLRNAWLRDQGLVGGVRTFRNPLTREAGGVNPTRAEPAAWFTRPPERPRTRSREQVRISLPPGLDARGFDHLIAAAADPGGHHCPTSTARATDRP